VDEAGSIDPNCRKRTSLKRSPHFYKWGSNFTLTRCSS